MSAGEFHKEPRQVGRPGSPCANSTHTPTLAVGLTRCRTGRGSAHPLSVSPVTSGLREDECTSLPPVCVRPVPHRPAARRGVAGHRQVTGRAAARPHNRPWEPAATRGDSALALRAPRPPGQGWVARRPPVPKGRLDNHRRAPYSCYTPARPCGAHGPVPRPGMTHRQTLALTGHHCDPSSVRRRRAPATAVGGVAWAAGVATFAQSRAIWIVVRA